MASSFGERRPTEIHALHCRPLPVGESAVTGYGRPGQDGDLVALTGLEVVAWPRSSRLRGERWARCYRPPPIVSNASYGDPRRRPTWCLMVANVSEGLHHQPAELEASYRG